MGDAHEPTTRRGHLARLSYRQHERHTDSASDQHTNRQCHAQRQRVTPAPPAASLSCHNRRSPSPHTASSSTNSAGVRSDDALPPTFHRSPSASASTRIFSRPSESKVATLPPRPPRAHSESPHPVLAQPVALPRTFSTPLVESAVKENSGGGDPTEHAPRSSSRLSSFGFSTLSRSHKRSNTSGPRSLEKRFSLRSFRRTFEIRGGQGIQRR